LETYLVIGLDRFDDSPTSDSHESGVQADFILLIVLDNDTKQSTAIQINRDTIARMNRLGVAGDKIGTVKQQIALSHTYGNGKEVSCRNTVDAVSQLLFGVKIHHYVSLTMEAVPTYNDLVGGVTLTVLDDLTSLDSALVKDAVVTLNGEQALTYVRGRYGLDEPTNIARMKRQRQYISALYEQSNKKAEADKSFSIEVAKSLSKYIVSDCTLNQMQTLYDKFAIYDFEGISKIKGESVVGEQYMEFYPDVNSMKQTVVELFYKKED
jgi:LCP family protein required for cell wall assembly